MSKAECIDPVDYRIPLWCNMPLNEHRTMGGCWGISSGQQQEGGLDYCKACEYRDKEIAEVLLAAENDGTNQP